MLNRKSASLLALLVIGAATGSGCAGVTTVHCNWEDELTAGLGLSCHDIRHIGYGIHYDIVLNGQQTATRQGAGAPTHTPHQPLNKE